MKKMKHLLILLAICINIGCRNKINDTLVGSWSIDTIYFKNNDVKDCLYDNILEFESNNIIDLPFAGNRCPEILQNDKNNFGKWEVLISKNKVDTFPIKIKISSNNELFSGVHYLIFHNDPDLKLLKAEIFSNNLYLICRKGYFNYDENYNLIEKLKYSSWTNRPGNKTH
jgi:hypothetical protein